MKADGAIMKTLKRIAALLPPLWQNELKRIHFRRQMRRGDFVTSEPEYSILPSLISAGDWVIDVGANVGHYTKRFSELVGAAGRVIAFEPVPETFALLAANLQALSVNNVTLINAAASDETNLVGMAMGAFDTGLRNFYRAHLSKSSDIGLQVLTLSLDSLNIKNSIALIKIDVEGHEANVLKGMHEIVARDQPTLIVETGSREVEHCMRTIGYTSGRLDGSPNILCVPTGNNTVHFQKEVKNL
ncbi:MAG: FkbM family methyltransferase [Nitrososphaera sp.]|nr:FkbM family methyltransferase [Nitrososphaera sp.]